jgi:hypothetical protein
MIYFMALLPATGLAIAGYFVLYLSQRSEGTFQTFGKYLGFWTFTLAVLVLLGGLVAAAHGGLAGGMMGMRGMHAPMHGYWQGERRGPGPDWERFRGAERPRGAPPGDGPQVNPVSPPGPAAPAPR